MRRVYPFNHPRKCYFYYTRNAIYHLAMKLNQLGLKKVLFPAYNHGVEVEAMLAGGEELIYYNIHTSGEIDYNDLERKITPQTRVLYIIHYNGFPQNMDAVMALKKKHNLILIEDAALSLFARHGDQYVGEFGEVAVFCLYKALAIPNGGLLVINQPEFDLNANSQRPEFLSTLSRLGGLHLHWLAENVSVVGRNLQKVKTKVKKIFSAAHLQPIPVGDYSFDASISDWGISRLSQWVIDRSDVEEIIQIRRQNFEYLSEMLEGESLCCDVKPMYPQLPPEAVPLFFPLLVNNRERIHHDLLSEGVESSLFWRDWHPDIPAEQFPEVALLRESVLELPIHQGVSRSHIEYLVEKLKAALSKSGKAKSSLAA